MKKVVKIEYTKLYNVPSLWMVGDELGMCIPDGKLCECIHFSSKFSKWTRNEWDADLLYCYSEHPDVEFIGFIEWQLL